MYEITNFGDRYTASDRINWFYAKKAKQFKLSKLFVKVMKYLFVLFALAFLAVTVQAKVIDIGIKSQQLHNLVVYKDINGFQPVH